MTNVSITYNPYKVQTRLIVNGEEPRQNSTLTQYLNERLQLWVDKIPQMLREEYNDSNMKITFHGTGPDYQDLLEAAKLAEENDGIVCTVEKEQAKEYGDKESDIKELFSRVEELPFSELKSSSVKDAVELAFNENLEINVAATMSAGKSTLINALLGKNLMPSKQGACTAIITRIKDNDSPVYEAVVYDEDGNQLEQCPQINYEIMKSFNGNKDVSEVDVSGNIPFVKSNEISLVLIDTPGPDNARDPRHGKVTAQALDKSSKMLVMFVMNGGTLHNEEQDRFLRRIAESMKVEGKQSKERFIFVINKMDDYFPPDDDIENDTLPETVRYLENMGIKNPNIFPVSAKLALDIRRYLDPNDVADKIRLKKDVEYTAERMIECDMLHLEKYPRLPYNCRTVIDSELEAAKEKGDILGQALVHSGIRGVEEFIKMYVEKYCRPAKITNVVNAFSHGLEAADAFNKTKEEIASRSNELSEIKDKIDKLKMKLASKKENEAFKERIRNLNIKSQFTDDVNILVAEFEGELTSFFNQGPDEMDEETAKEKVDSFDKLAKSKSYDFQVAVENYIKDDIKDMGNKLLEEYVKKLIDISDELGNADLKIDWKKYVVGEFVTIDADIDAALDTRIEKHTEMRTEVYKEKVKGLKRLFQPKYWFNPYKKMTREIPVEIKEEITYVSKDKLSSGIMADIREWIYGERNNIIEYSKEATKSLKKYFEERFDEVDKILSEKMEELSQAVSSKDAADRALQEAKEMSKKLDEIKQELEGILEI